MDLVTMPDPTSIVKFTPILKGRPAGAMMWFSSRLRNWLWLSGLDP